jgi:hypothetical protein
VAGSPGGTSIYNHWLQLEGTNSAAPLWSFYFTLMPIFPISLVVWFPRARKEGEIQRLHQLQVVSDAIVEFEVGRVLLKTRVLKMLEDIKFIRT